MGNCIAKEARAAGTQIVFAAALAVAVSLTSQSLADSGATIIARPSLALLPPMGWNSWNCLTEHVTEQAVREMADAMVSSGMKGAGYQYIVVDDFWEQGRVSKTERKVEDRPGRDANGILLVDPVRFPSGIKALADYVHSKGLKFGIYTSPGDSTCGASSK